MVWSYDDSTSDERSTNWELNVTPRQRERNRQLIRNVGITDA